MFGKQLVAFVCLAICLAGLALGEQYQSLDGTDWTATSANQSIKVKAKVPGSIYSDLRREGVLKEEIYKGMNDVQYRWVANDNWTFTKDFKVDAGLLAKERVNLRVHGLDTIASIYINDALIGKTDNQFVRYIFDVKKNLKTDQNSIKVVFESAIAYGKKRAEDYHAKYGYTIVPECDPDLQNGECHWNFVRKMASSFSWDWGPAFPTQGVWKPIGIEALDKAVIRDVTVETKPDPKDKTQWTLTVNTFVDVVGDKPLDATFNIKLDDHHLIEDQTQALTPGTDGSAKVRIEIPLKNVSITSWFPNGVADNTQKLYRLNVSLSFKGSQEVSAHSQRIGFRTIELVQEPVKPEGLTFYFKVNGYPFFAKGSNWIPAHVLMEELTPEYIRFLLKSAKLANMNMMRVWGGGVYESDLLYELADEFGIMIWQDFMFACSVYPSDDTFFQSVDQEIKTQVRRIQHHPSIAIWAGNNENEIGIAGWWPRDSHYKPDYVKLYVDHIKTFLDKEDTTRPYVTSSPSNGLESAKENYTAADPGDTRYGDVHYYNDGATLWDWHSFPSPKFASEFGFQSYPSVKTLLRSIAKENLTFPITEALEHRQHHGGGTESIENQISKYMRLPTKGGIDRFDDLVYLSQISQAMAMKTETEFYRRNREINPKNGDGYTMGALYWQLNDIWEAPSWASIEFGGKWKVLHSYARSFLDNHLVVPYVDQDVFNITFVRDDYFGDLNFKYSLKVYSWSKAGEPVHENRGDFNTTSFSSTNFFLYTMGYLMDQSGCPDRPFCVLRVEVWNEEHDIKVENFLLLSELKNSQITEPKLKLVDVKKRSELVDNRHVFDITLSTEAVAAFVVLDFGVDSGIDGQFYENGFFVFDSQKTVTFVTDSSDLTEDKIKTNLKIKTVTDVK